MKKLVMMIGLPGSGKSTYAKSLTKCYPDLEFVVLSTDDYIENKAVANGTTYADIFQDTYKEAEEFMFAKLQYAIDNGISVFWDQTNLNKKTRMKKLDKIPDDYVRAFVLYSNTDIDSLLERQKNRKPTKIIPRHVMTNMANSLEWPDADEGFREGLVIYSR